MVRRGNEQDKIGSWAKALVHFLAIGYLSIVFLSVYTYLTGFLYNKGLTVQHLQSLAHYLVYFIMEQSWAIGSALFIYGIIFSSAAGKVVIVFKIIYLIFMAAFFSFWCYEQKVFPEKDFGYLTILSVYLLTGSSLLLVQEYSWRRSIHLIH